MFRMDEDQMKSLLRRCAWGTLSTSGPDSIPYAIEFTYFMMDDHLCALINPKGTIARNIEHNPDVCFKVCLSDPLCRRFEAISCFGKASFEQDREKVSRAWDQLEERLQYKPGTYSRFKEKFGDPNNPSPLFSMKIEKMTGVANHKGMDVEK